LIKQLQGNISLALPAAQNNFTNWLAYANTGAFTANTSNVNEFSAAILLGLNTYIVSEAYNAAGVIVTRSPDTDVHALSTNSTSKDLRWTPCKSGYTANGFCEGFWYNNKTGITYGLVETSKAKQNRNFTADFETIFSNWTTPELFFVGGDRCAQTSGRNGGTPPSVNLGILAQDPTGLLGSCFANVQTCTWDLTPQPLTGGGAGNSVGPPAASMFIESSCDYKNQSWFEGLPENQKDCGSEPYAKYSMIVPDAYLGWGIFKSETTNPSNQNEIYYDYCTTSGGGRD